MAPPRRQSEAAARQTVGFLAGSLAGFAIGFRLLMNDTAAADPNLWATCLVIVIGCGIAGRCWWPPWREPPSSEPPRKPLLLPKAASNRDKREERSRLRYKDEVQVCPRRSRSK